jgi:hypothetical protein
MAPNRTDLEKRLAIHLERPPGPEKQFRSLLEATFSQSIPRKIVFLHQLGSAPAKINEESQRAWLATTGPVFAPRRKLIFL